jgi:hypothetical protein
MNLKQKCVPLQFSIETRVINGIKSQERFMPNVEPSDRR